ncbi:class I SAM-dependent methyltransferase [Candidatus Woesebacteria bacterium]|nr:MAG: class I SAM-dependent methyltransferase [Candidatus Woesebacteria bacterium]
MKKNKANNKDYSEALPFAMGEKSRQKKARQIHHLISAHLKKNTKKLILLDYGASIGTIADYMSKYYKHVVGVDVDVNAIKKAKTTFKKKNLNFKVTTDERIPYKDDSFDIVIANQVYNCVENQKLMFDEIYRILKPGGICFLGARNRFVIIESQYKLPLLTFLPSRLADYYVRIMGKGNSFMGNKYLSHQGIKKLCHKFIIHDYTIAVLRNPEKFGFDGLVKYKPISKLLPQSLILPFMPNYIFLLEKN